MRKAPTYLTKFGISIREKKYSIENPKQNTFIHFKETPSNRFATKYGYFAVDKKGNINFIISLNDRKSKTIYNIKIAKQHIFQSLLYSLQFKPVRYNKNANENFFTHKDIISLMELEECNDMSLDDIKEQYKKVVSGMKSLIEETDNDVRKRTAELQLENLLKKQAKMEYFYEIRLCEEMLKE